LTRRNWGLAHPFLKKAAPPLGFQGWASQKSPARDFDLWNQSLSGHPSQRGGWRWGYHPGMGNRLKRYYGAGYLHFITTSCYRRRAPLASARRRDLFLKTLEQTRRRYKFVVVGYVVMLEHIHLLISEPERGKPSCAGFVPGVGVLRLRE
jgi:hypothetical protein